MNVCILIKRVDSVDDNIGISASFGGIKWNSQVETYSFFIHILRWISLIKKVHSMGDGTYFPWRNFQYVRSPPELSIMGCSYSSDTDPDKGVLLESCDIRFSELQLETINQHLQNVYLKNSGKF